MEQYIIKGGHPLVGEVEIGGAKNAALAILAAAIMTDETVLIDNLPDVNDINVLIDAIEGIGAKVHRVDRHTVKINGASIKNVDIEYDYIKKIQLSGSFLLSLINYVLEMARIESGKATLRTEVGDAQELLGALNAVFEPAVEKKRLKYNCTLDVEHRFIICDVTKVREIVLNIISNSVKYTPEGGSVTVQIKEIQWVKEGWSAFRILVDDKGIGMGAE